MEFIEGNITTAATSENYKISVSVHFVYGG
jgi:hypothetical protein